jgi:hypothetical protein
MIPHITLLFEDLVIMGTDIAEWYSDGVQTERPGFDSWDGK